MTELEQRKQDMVVQKAVLSTLNEACDYIREVGLIGLRQMMNRAEEDYEMATRIYNELQPK